MTSRNLYSREGQSKERRYDREREMRAYERSFRGEPSGGRQIRDRDRDELGPMYGRRGYGWSGPDSPDPRERRARDPRAHTRDTQRRFDALIDHLRDEVRRIDDPQLEAILETSAEVLSGLKKTFRDYERRNEEPWR